MIASSAGRRIWIAVAGLSATLCLWLAPSANADPTLLGQYGLGGAGGDAGELNSPDGVAVDAAGKLYVAEDGNDRISVFDPQGAFVRAFGFDVIPGGGAGFEVCTTSCQPGLAGGGVGQLNNPSGVAFDAAGNLYVADRGNARISVFDAQGAFVRAFGWNVVPGGPVGFEICTASCQAGDAGGGSGQLNFPEGAAIDAAGNLYIGDQLNHRISVFDAQGGFVRTFGWNVGPGGASGFEICTLNCEAGVAGSNAGQFGSPDFVATDPAGNLFVADRANHRIAVHNAQGDFLRAFGFDVIPSGGSGLETCTVNCQQGASGGGAGQLNAPSGVGLDAAGHLVVADSGNDRISVFTAQGAFLHAFGFDVIPGGGGGFETCTASCQAGVGGSAAGQFDLAWAVATDCRGAIYVSDLNAHRIQRFGEPGTAPPPCTTPPPTQPPSNDFTIGKLKRNTKKGTAKLTVELPGPGQLELSGKNVKPRTKQAAAAGETVLAVKAKGKGKRKLAEKGKLKIKLSLTFTPTGGEPNTLSKKGKLKRAR